MGKYYKALCRTTVPPHIYQYTGVLNFIVHINKTYPVALDRHVLMAVLLRVALEDLA